MQQSIVNVSSITGVMDAHGPTKKFAWMSQSYV